MVGMIISKNIGRWYPLKEIGHAAVLSVKGPTLDVSSSGGELSIESAAVSELAGSLDSRLLLQADEGYAAAKKVWNGMFDSKQP